MFNFFYQYFLSIIHVNIRIFDQFQQNDYIFQTLTTKFGYDSRGICIKVPQIKPFVQIDICLIFQILNFLI